jgi:hypothetical protein
MRMNVGFCRESISARQGAATKLFGAKGMGAKFGVRGSGYRPHPRRMCFNGSFFVAWIIQNGPSRGLSSERMKQSKISVFLCLMAATAIAVAAPAGPVFEMRLVLDGPASDTEPMYEITHNGSITATNVVHVQKTILLDQTAVKSAKASKDALGQPLIEIAFTDAGAKKLAEVTRENLHRRLAIIIDGQFCEAPVIQTEISGGVAEISGRFSKGETQALAKKINAALAGH